MHTLSFSLAVLCWLSMALCFVGMVAISVYWIKHSLPTRSFIGGFIGLVISMIVNGVSSICFMVAIDMDVFDYRPFWFGLGASALLTVCGYVVYLSSKCTNVRPS